MPSASAVHRLTLHRYVPEMGLLIVGSQGYPQVDLLYVLRYDDRVAMSNGADRANDETRAEPPIQTGGPVQLADGSNGKVTGNTAHPLDAPLWYVAGHHPVGFCASDNLLARNRKRRQGSTASSGMQGRRSPACGSFCTFSRPRFKCLISAWLQQATTSSGRPRSLLNSFCCKKSH